MIVGVGGVVDDYQVSLIFVLYLISYVFLSSWLFRDICWCFDGFVLLGKVFLF